MPDILRSVTLEEILQAVDIVAEEEEEAAAENLEETNETGWNMGRLKGEPGTVFLNNIGSYLDET